MSSLSIYKVLYSVYDLLDVVYFRDHAKSPRTAVLKKIKDDDRVLDLCTGTGTNALSIAKAKPLTKIAGIDLSKDMLKVAKDKLKRSGLKNVKFYLMDATKLRFKDSCFDKILISLILHEMEEELTDQIIMEAMRVLKDDGKIL